MSNHTIYLWAVAPDADATQVSLTEAISKRGRAFSPHVTIASWKTSEDIESIVKKARAFSATLPARIDAQVASIGQGKTYYQSIFLEFGESTKKQLQDVHNKAKAAFGLPAHEETYMPHLSLYYGQEKERELALQSIMADQALKSIRTIPLTHLQVVIGAERQWDWTYIGRSPLSTDRFFRDSMMINGRWVAARSGERFSVVNPATKEVIHTVPSAQAEDIDDAVRAAHDAFLGWSKTAPKERAKFLNLIADEIQASISLLAEIEILDNGKPFAEAEMDMNDAADCFRYYAGLIVEREAEHDGKYVDVGNPSVKTFVRREPLGVCGLIIPWNYPMLMAAWKLAPALAAGCTMVLKPSELTPLSALELAAIAHRVGLPKGVLNIVTGFGPQAGTPLVKHNLVQKVAFTGSVLTGSKIATMAAKEIKKCTLELGGKSAIIVNNDIDVDQAVDWISVGIFFNCGQVCSATSRLIVHEQVKDKVLTRLAEVAKSIKIGSGLDKNNKLGPVVSESQYKKIVNYIKGAIDQGAKVITGGVPAEREGFFIEPTVLEVTTDMTVWKEEIFGPVLCVHSFSTIDEALDLANETTFGLGAAVISQDKATCLRVSRELEAGIVWVNCSQPTFVQAPWGGYKQSGIGRELGPWGLENYLETKQIVNWVDESAKGWGWFM